MPSSDEREARWPGFANVVGRVTKTRSRTAPFTESIQWTAEIVRSDGFLIADHDFPDTRDGWDRAVAWAHAETKEHRFQTSCEFNAAWIGACHRPGLHRDGRCDQHTRKKCWSCGAPAVRDCAHTCMLVCSMPGCALHPHEETHR